MRSLTLLFVLLLSGCSCDFGFDWEGPPECSVDSDCPPDDDLYCNGVAACELTGFIFTQWQCTIREPNCDDGYCDEATDECRACESRDDAPECVYRWRGDAGPDANTDANRLCDPLRYRDLGLTCPFGSCGGSGLECFEEVAATLGPLERTFRSLCSSECDPSAAESGCGPCDACVDTMRFGEHYIAVSDLGRAPHCAPRCEPMRDSRGCGQPGSSCDVVTGTCMDACTSDEECRLVQDELGAWIEEPESMAVCDSITGRCRRWGTLRARIGDACEVGGDCTIDGVCLRSDGWPVNGYCTRLDCQWSELACEEGEQCHYRAFDRPACLIACTVGAESEEDRTGIDGHGAGCTPGLACRWDGRTVDTSPNGGCMPGNYNDVAAPNLGEPCTRDDECFSPFGAGRCVFAESGTGTCALIDCDAPGFECPEGASCVAIGEDSFCIRDPAP